MINAIGNAANGADGATRQVRWRTRLEGRGLSSRADCVSPPALGAELAYMTTAGGHIVVLNQAAAACGSTTTWAGP